MNVLHANTWDTNQNPTQRAERERERERESRQDLWPTAYRRVLSSNEAETTVAERSVCGIGKRAAAKKPHVMIGAARADRRGGGHGVGGGGHAQVLTKLPKPAVQSSGGKARKRDEGR